MRIAHVVNWYLPGMGYEENHLPMEQSKLGNEVTIVTSNRVPEAIRKGVGLSEVSSGRFGAGYRQETGSVNLVRLRSFPEVAGQQVLVGLRRTLAKMRPEVVHVHGAFGPITSQCVLYQRSLGYRLFIDDHSHPSKLRIRGPLTTPYVWLVSTLLNVCDSSVSAYLSTSKASNGLLQHHLGIDPRRIAITTLGVDGETFYRRPELRQPTRQASGLESARGIVVHAGRMDRDKGIEQLLQAFSQVLAHAPGSVLLLIGGIEPRYRSELELAIASSKLEANVRFVGFVEQPDLAAWYNAADFGVWPALPSITVLQAMACGLPCLVPSDEIEYQAFLGTSSCIGFHRDDVKDMSRVMLKVLSDGRLRGLVGDNAASVAGDTLVWRSIAEKTLDIYQHWQGHCHEATRDSRR